MLDDDVAGDSSAQDVLAMIMGFGPRGPSDRYCFLGVVDGTTGVMARPLYNLTLAYRQWAYLYSGVSAWDGARGLYYLEAVTGVHDYTSLFVFNTSDGSEGATPLAQLPFPGGFGMYMGLARSPALAARYDPGGPGLLALADDDSNTAAALWLLTTPGGNWSAAAWLPLYQYAPDTLTSAGNDLLELSDDGFTAYSVFYDNHRPIANQVVSAVDLRTAPGVEVGRTIVNGSEDGTAGIADLAACPAARRGDGHAARR